MKKRENVMDMLVGFVNVLIYFNVIVSRGERIYDRERAGNALRMLLVHTIVY